MVPRFRQSDMLTGSLRQLIFGLKHRMSLYVALATKTDSQ